MNGVDCYDQLFMKYDVGCFSVKAIKYILWDFVNTIIVSAYICTARLQEDKPKRSVLILTFDLRLQWD